MRGSGELTIAGPEPDAAVPRAKVTETCRQVLESLERLLEPLTASESESIN